MTSTGHNGDEQRNDMDDLDDRSADGVDQKETTCASGHGHVPAAVVTGVRLFAESDDDGDSAGEARHSSQAVPSSNETPRCERHGDRTAELYCQTCAVSICVACATTRHLPASGHLCWDIADTIDHCRTRLAQRAAELADSQISCLSRIEDINVRIESIRNKTDEQETQIRRHFEETRMRLEKDLNRLIQDMEKSKNGWIKELKKLGSELQAAAVKLEGQSHQLQQMSVYGTAGEVIEECASDMSATRLDLPSLIAEPADYQPLQFIKSDLQQAKNLVGQLTTETNRASVVWTCEICTYVNEDKHIECQMCAYAPWKQKIGGLRLPVTQNQAIGERSGQSDDQVGRKWTCSLCTLINKPTSSACMTCETARSADISSRLPAEPPSYVVVACMSTANQNRAPSPGIIVGTVNAATQTEETSGVFGLLSQLKQQLVNRRTPASSRDSSPRTRTAHSSPPEGATAHWACSRCKFENNMDKMECGKCGFEEPSPTATFSSQ